MTTHKLGCAQTAASMDAEDFYRLRTADAKGLGWDQGPSEALRPSEVRSFVAPADTDDELAAFTSFGRGNRQGLYEARTLLVYQSILANPASIVWRPHASRTFYLAGEPSDRAKRGDLGALDEPIITLLTVAEIDERDERSPFTAVAAESSDLVSECVQSEVLAPYALENPAKVRAFLEGRPAVIDLLRVIPKKAQEYFGVEVQLSISVIEDSEYFVTPELFVTVGTALPQDEAMERFMAMLSSWWVSAVPDESVNLDVRSS